jgi:NAD(P)-dependent dehydrogenase (short-subunit alcohol dehydrogenase family)
VGGRVRPEGVRVNAVSPGPPNTPGTEAQGEGFAAIVSTIPSAAPPPRRTSPRRSSPRLRQGELTERSGRSRRPRPGRSLTPAVLEAERPGRRRPGRPRSRLDVLVAGTTTEPQGAAIVEDAWVRRVRDRLR